jgi:POT family proton-dependent oligopeptide transporter
MTAAEVFISITCLEFSYTQAPKHMKSWIMSLYLASVMVGNLFTAGVNSFIQNPDGTSRLSDTEYYLFFSALMAVTAVLFIPVARWFKEHRYIHGDEAASA